MNVWMMIGQTVGISLGISLVGLIMIVIGTIIWVRIAVKGRVYCYFFDENKQLFGRILSPHSNAVVLGGGGEAEKYLIEPSKLFWSFWPPGFPRFIQEPIPTLLYVRNNVEPFDPYNLVSLISAKSFHKVSDEAMLKQTWKDVRESVGIKAIAGGNTLLIILILAAVLVSGVAAYLSFTSLSEIDRIMRILGG